MKKTLLAASFAALCSTSALASQADIWLDVQAKDPVVSSVPGVALQARKVVADKDLLQQHFADKHVSVEVEVPLPSGGYASFTLTPKSVFAPELAARYPQLMSYQGYSHDAGVGPGRFEISPNGLRGMFKYLGERVFVGPQHGTEATYYSFFEMDAEQDPSIRNGETDFLLAEKPDLPVISAKSVAQRNTGDTVRTYRLAITTTGEYTQRFGSVNNVMAELNTLVNRINSLYLNDIAVQFELIADNDRLVFLDGDTDPFANDGSLEDISQNQETTDEIIGSANYDLGHILYFPSDGGGGVAFIGAACDFRIKAQGTSGSRRPFGETFYVDLVAHEFGHQMGALHTFNATNSDNCDEDQRAPASSVEPGSGSTIMGYAGICASADIQQEADPYFHAQSINEMRDYVENTNPLFGGSCGTVTNPANALPQITLAQTQYTIPSSTPFILTASASDADSGDTLTYAWDQIDADVGDNGATFTREEINQDNGFNPLFRSFEPVTTPTRFFPNVENLRSGAAPLGETLPTTQRELNFELVVRDNAGATDLERVSIDVELAGDGFAVTEPAAGEVWIGRRIKTVAWNVAGTDTGNINCANVDIMLDVDQQNTFDVMVAEGVPNTGSAEVSVPSSPTAQARVMVKCSDNIFFALNPGDIEVQEGVAPTVPVITGQQFLQINEDQSLALSLSDLTIDDPDTAFPDGFTLNILAGDNYTFEGTVISPDANFNGMLNVNINVNDGDADSPTFVLQVDIEPLPDAPIAIDDVATVDQDSANNNIDVLANDEEPDGEALAISAIDYSGSGQLVIADNQLVYSPAAGFSGQESATYTVEDVNGLSATASVQLNVNAAPTTPPPAPTPPPSNSGGGGGGSAGWLLALMGVALGMRRRLTLNKE